MFPGIMHHMIAYWQVGHQQEHVRGEEDGAAVRVREDLRILRRPGTLLRGLLSQEMYVAISLRVLFVLSIVNTSLEP